MDTEVLDPIVPGYDSLCLTLDVFPEHVWAEYNTIRAAMDTDVSAIGAAARENELNEVRWSSEEESSEAE